MSKLLGTAWVSVLPDAAGFKPAAVAAVKRALVGVQGNVKLDFDTRDLTPQLAKVEADLQVLHGLSNIDLTLANASGLHSIDNMRDRVIALQALLSQMPVDVNDAKAQSSIANLLVQSKGLASELHGMDISIDTAEARAQVLGFQAKVEALTKKTDIPIGITDPDLAAQIATIQAKVSAFGKGLDNIPVSLDDRDSVAKVSALQAQAVKLATSLRDVKSDVDVSAAMAKLAALDAAAAKFQTDLTRGGEKLDLNTTLAGSSLSHLDDQAKTLQADIERALSPSGITLGKVDHSTSQDLQGLLAALVKIRAEASDLSTQGILNPDDITRVSDLKTALGSLSKAVADNGVAVSSTAFSYRGWVNAMIDIARVQIPLFNGAFEKMLPHFLAVASGTHILIEAALELVAVWVPAAVALGVFGLAAAKTAIEVAKDAKNMETAAQGTGQAFAGMSQKAGQAMSNLAKPYVYTAVGLGMIAVQHQAATTGSVIQSMGSTIDKWISEAVVAYQKGTGAMAQKGSQEFAVLGDAFKNLGTAVEGFIKVTPGYAKDLLGLGDSVLHAASAILNSGFAQAFGKIFLAAHGAFFYLGLFATLGTKMASWFLKPLASIKLFSGALNGMGIEASGAQGKMSKTINAMVDGWQQGTGRLTTSAKLAGGSLDDALNTGIVAAGEDAEKNTQSLMSKLATTMTMGMSTVGTAVKDGSTVIKSSLGSDVEGSFVNTGAAATGFKVAASDAMSALGSNVAIASKGVKGALSGLFSTLGISPWMLAVGAAAGVFLVLQRDISGATASAKQFQAAADAALGNTTSVQQFGKVYTQELGTAQKQLAVTKQQLGSLGDFGTKNLGGPGGPLNDLVNSLTNIIGLGKHLPQSENDATAAYKAQKAAVQDLVSDNNVYQGNLAAIAKANGVSLPDAFALATQAGLSTNDMMKGGATQMAANVIETQAANKAYASLVNGIGGVHTAYEALNIQNSQTLKDAQSVASAFQNYTTLITGGVNAFDTWTQGETELNSNISATGDIASTVTLKLGKFSDKIAVTGKGLDAITPASIAANQAFLAQVNNSQALYGSLIQLAAASGNTATAQHTLSVAGKDMISTLVKTAGGSKNAMTQVYALAQTFGYTGKDVLPNLVKWLGTSGDKTQDLQSKVNGLTAAAGNLANAAKQLSGALSTDLNNAMSQSIVDAEGGQAAFNKFAKAVQAYNTPGGQTAANMKAVTTQGNAMAKMLITSTGSANAAEPILQNYLQTLGMGSTQAKALATQLLGLKSPVQDTAKQMETASQVAAGWASEMKLPVKSVQELQSTLSQPVFSEFIKSGESSSNMLTILAAGMHLTQGQSADMFSEFAKANLDWLSGKTKQASDEFEGLLEKMGLTPASAAAVWAALQKQNLDQLTTKIGLNKTAFVQLATQMGDNSTKAAGLWTALAKNNFSLVDGDIATNKQKFMDLAGQFGITGKAATDLWTKIVSQQVQGILSGNIKTTKSVFEGLEGQLGTTKTAADKLWDSLQQLGKANVTPKVTVAVAANGSFTANASVAGGKNVEISAFHLAGGKKDGGIISGQGPAGIDSVPTMLAPGELVIPTTHVSKFADMARKSSIPGFAAGGLVGTDGFSSAGSYASQVQSQASSSDSTFTGDAGSAFSEAAYNALIQASATGGSAKGNQILSDAEQYKGHKYVWGGASNPSQGWDCSSFVGYILGHDFHMPLPGPTAWNQNVHGPVAAQYNNEPGFGLVSHNTADIQAGDLLVENSGGHVGFGVGPDKMFSAYGTSYGTIFSDAQNMTNIYRDGSGAAQGAAPKLTAGQASNPLVNQMAASILPAMEASSALSKLYPALGAAYSGNPGQYTGGTVAGGSLNNLLEIAKYLMSVGASAAGAAGIAGTIDGESGGNPESVGTGGFGLIGWTGNTIGLPSGYAGPTGNVSADMNAQMAGIVGYAQARPGGWPGGFGTATDPVAAGHLWSVYEAPKSPGSDERPSVSQQIYAALGGAGTAAVARNPALATSAAAAVTVHGHQSGLARGGLVGMASGGVVADPKRKITSTLNTPVGNILLPEWLRYNADQLKKRVSDETTAVNHDQALMNKYFAAGNMSAYLKESQIFNKDSSTLGNSASALTQRTAYDKMTPAQQATQRASADNTVAVGQAAIATQDLSKVQALAMRIINDKKVIAKAQAAVGADDKNLAALKAKVNLDQASVTKASGGSSANAAAIAQMDAQLGLDRAAISKAKKGSPAWTKAEARLAADTMARAQLSTVKSNDSKAVTTAKNALKNDTSAYDSAMSNSSSGNKTLAADVSNENLDVKAYNAAMKAYANQEQTALFWKAEEIKATKLATTETTAAAKAAATAATNAAKLTLYKPNNAMDTLVDKITTSPALDYLMGPGSTSAAGWAIQPVLGDLMIDKVFQPSTWVGKPNTDQEAVDSQTNYYNSQAVIRQYLNSVGAGKADVVLGSYTGVHGKDAQGRAFALGGTIGEKVLGVGQTTGIPYAFGAGERVVTPAGQKTEAAMGTRELQSTMEALLQEQRKANQIAQQAPHAYASALNGSAGRKVIGR